MNTDLLLVIIAIVGGLWLLSGGDKEEAIEAGKKGAEFIAIAVFVAVAIMWMLTRGL